MVLPYRGFVHRRTASRVEALASGKDSPYALPWQAFRADLIAWIVAGLGMTVLYLRFYNAPFLTGVKVMMGCLSFGLFGGMWSFLRTEDWLMSRLQRTRAVAAVAPRRILSVSTKMIFLMLTVLVFMVLMILLMVFMDLNYLLAHKDSIGPEIYTGVFKEIVFAFSVLLVMSLMILERYSRNLKRILAIQVEAMEGIGRGEYDARVPVVSNDEFGIIAAKTNALIEGLKERDACQISFSKYMTPEISQKILNGEISPEGELRRVTLLFCDLRGYTPFAESREPKEVVRFLNEYFSEMEGVIRRHNGIVLQYIGDEIEAVFGAPIEEPRHAEKAVMAALDMRLALARLNERRRQAGEELIRHGIGIHTGEVFAGSVGSPERLVYAMVGDTVNLASRIQALNKQFGTDILISQSTRQCLTQGLFHLESLGRPSIRGKREEIEIYRVEGMHA